MSATTDFDDGANLETLERLRRLHHPNCFVCGERRSGGLNMTFALGPDGDLLGTFDCNRRFEGYPGRVHGGIITGLFDEIMANYLLARGRIVITVNLEARFRHPVLVDVPAELSASLSRATGDVYYMKSRLVQSGRVCTTAQGCFLERHNDLE